MNTSAYALASPRGKAANARRAIARPCARADCEPTTRGSSLPCARLLTFTVAQALRVRYALRKSPELSWCAMWFVLSAVASLLTYNNATTLTYGGFLALLRRWGYLHSKLVISRLGLARPMATFVILSLGAALAIGGRILLREFVAKADADGDGKISRQE